MSKKDGYSRPGFFGGMNHYDESGRKVDNQSKVRYYMYTISILTMKNMIVLFIV